MGKFCDLTGMKFGKLTVIKRAPNRGVSTMWECLCECGNTTVVAGGHLKNGHTSSCGCYHSEALTNRNYIHGLSHQRLYTIWANMKQRCSNSNNPKYINYGNRGISVCEDWANNFVNFKDWALSHGYDDTLTIDRIDVNGDYCPENCRWITSTEQALNRTDNHRISYNGKTMTLKEWSNCTGIPFSVLEARINRYKWPASKALTRPVQSNKSNQLTNGYP